VVNQSLTLELDGIMAAALATGLFVSSCTITELPSPITLGPSGAPTDAYVNVTGMVGIQCMKAPLMVNNLKMDDETRRVEHILTEADEHVLLASYYPLITTKNRAVIDGVDYIIMAVEHDSQGKMTRL
jgi:hypothetical protein